MYMKSHCTWSKSGLLSLIWGRICEWIWYAQTAFLPGLLTDVGAWFLPVKALMEPKIKITNWFNIQVQLSLADFLWRPKQHLDSSEKETEFSYVYATTVFSIKRRRGLFYWHPIPLTLFPELVWHLVTSYHALVPHSSIPPARMQTPEEGLQFQDIPPIELCVAAALRRHSQEYPRTLSTPSE